VPRPGKGGEGIERVSEDVVVLLIVLGLVLHEFFCADPPAEGAFALQVLRPQQEADVEVGVGVFVLVLFDDDHHRPVVVVAMAEGFLAVLQLIEVVLAPVPAVDEVETVQFEDVGEEREDVRPVRTEVSTG